MFVCMCFIVFLLAAGVVWSEANVEETNLQLDFVISSWEYTRGERFKE